MRDDQKTKAHLRQELNTLRERVSEHKQAEEGWSKIFDAISDLVFVQDKDFKFVKVNKFICDVLKVKPEDLIGKKCYEVLHKTDKPWPSCPTIKALKDKRPHTEEVYDPNIGISLLISTSPLFDETGELIGVVHVAKDITERKRAEEKLKQYQFMIESAYDAIFFKDLKSRYIIANNKTLEAFGLSREQVIGKNDYEIIPSREEARKNIEDDNVVFKTGKPTEITKHMTSADGKERWFQAIKVPQFDDEGKIIGLIGIARDITEHKRTEEALWVSEERYRTLFESSRDGIATANMKGYIMECNQAYADMLGYSREELKKIRYQDITPCKWHAFNEKIFQEVMEHGYSNVFEKEYIKKDGTVFPVSLHTWRIDEDGNPVGVGSVVRDITERKKAEDVVKAERRRLYSLLENLPAFVYLQAPDHSIRFANRYFREHFGDPEEKRCYEVLWGANEPCKPCPTFRVFDTKEPQVWEWEQSPDGRIYEINDYPFVDVNGSPLVLELGVDITEHKKAEEQIRKLSSAVEQSIDGIAIGDLEPKLIYVNDAFARMHGYTVNDLIGLPVAKLHNKEQMDEHKKALNQLKAQGSWEGEIGHIRKDGTPFLTYVSVTLLKNNKGEPTGTLAVTRDITESKRREEELNTYRENMVQAEELASVGTLSATLAHELNQPLTVIRLSIQNSLAELEKTSCQDTVVEDLKEGLSEISNMTSMVNRFRSFARMSTKRTVSKVDLKAVAERIVRLLDESAWREKVTLQVEGMDKLPLIYSYERDLEQLFFSLIENAIQAADGKKRRQVIISGAVRGEHIELQFSDNCGGIAPENLDCIFEPFFTTKQANERTGLGLCVVERIVSQLGGKVRVETKLGKGSTFFVTLPTNRGEK